MGPVILNIECIYSTAQKQVTKTKERVHSNKEVCQDLKNKKSKQNDTLSE